MSNSSSKNAAAPRGVGIRSNSVTKKPGMIPPDDLDNAAKKIVKAVKEAA